MSDFSRNLGSSMLRAMSEVTLVTSGGSLRDDKTVPSCFAPYRQMIATLCATAPADSSGHQRPGSSSSRLFEV
jgi:hypothetical protein